MAEKKHSVPVHSPEIRSANAGEGEDAEDGGDAAGVGDAIVIFNRNRCGVVPVEQVDEVLFFKGQKREIGENPETNAILYCMY